MYAHIDSIAFGNGFAVIAGWVSGENGSAVRLPLLIGFEGQAKTPVDHLTYRKDLHEAGIGGGHAAFAVTVPVSSDMSVGTPVVLYSEADGEFAAHSSDAVLSRFTPTGEIESTGEEGVVGWLHDPSVLFASSNSYLQFDNGVAVPVAFTGTQQDIHVSVRERLRFNVSYEQISTSFGSIGSVSDGQAHELTLISSGTEVARATLRSRTRPRRPLDVNETLHLRVVSAVIHDRLLFLEGGLISDSGAVLSEPVDFQLTAAAPVKVPEFKWLDVDGRSIALFRLVIEVEDRVMDLQLKLTAVNGRELAAVSLEQLELERSAHRAWLHRDRDGGLVGGFISLNGHTPTVLLNANGGGTMEIDLQADVDGEQVWSADGALAAAFRVPPGRSLKLLRATDSARTYDEGESNDVSLFAGGVKVASAAFAAVSPFEGRLESFEGGKISGWIGSKTDQYIRAVDIEVNGIRYATVDAVGRRSDLLRSGFSEASGGFRAEISNPEPGSNSLSLRVVAALSQSAVKKGEQLIQLPSIAQSRTGHVFQLLRANQFRSVSVVVPIYNAADDLVLCLQSLEEHTSGHVRVILIDDCSPDPRIGQVLSSLDSRLKIEIYRNAENLGFTKTVNRGIAYAGQDDVIFLNSDTIVTPGWVDGLRIAAYSAHNIATATPLSNNAGVYSVPEINLDNPFQAGMDVDAMARLVRQNSLGTLPRVPTGHGFCLYVRRDAIEAIGGLDEKAFPVGYGEENDFCMRAAYAGLENVCDDRTYIYHKRSASFGSKRSANYNHGQLTLRERYPEYRKLTAIFETGAEMLAVRWRVRKALAATRNPFLQKPRPRIAFVIATKTGGTPLTNQDLMSALSDRFECYVLRCDSRTIELYSHRAGKEPELIKSRTLQTAIDPKVHQSGEYDAIVADLLITYCIELVHVRHLGWHGLSLPSVCRTLGIPVVLSFHDFYTICPSIKLLDEEKRYCGGQCTPTEGECRVELWQADLFPKLKHGFIHRWQVMFGNVFEACDAFVTTSAYARDVLCSTYPKLKDRKFEVIPHGRDFSEFSACAVELTSGEALRILVPGNISPAKGATLIQEIAAVDGGQTVEFHILGDHGRIAPANGIVLHGKYERGDFVSRVDAIRPHLGAVLSIWPETYCHTLTEMWAAGIPVLGLDIGAVGERIAEHGGGWLQPADVKASVLLDAFRRLRDAGRIQAAQARVLKWQDGYGSHYGISSMADRYEKLYTSLSRSLS